MLEYRKMHCAYCDSLSKLEIIMKRGVVKSVHGVCTNCHYLIDIFDNGKVELDVDISFGAHDYEVFYDLHTLKIFEQGCIYNMPPVLLIEMDRVSVKVIENDEYFVKGVVKVNLAELRIIVKRFHDNRIML